MRLGRPIPPLSLSEEEKETLEQWVRRPKTAQALAQSPNRSEVRRRQDEHRCGGRVESVETYESGGLGSWNVAWTVWWTSHDLAESLMLRWRSRDTDIGDYSGGGNTLEHALNGPALWAESEHHQPHMACLRAAASPHRDLQAVGGPALCREGSSLWVSTSTRRTGHWSCVSTEDSDPGTGPHAAAVAHAPRPGAMITFGMALPPCLPLSTPGPAK